MFFWNMGKPWRKAEPFPKKNRKPCWRQYLKICRKATGRRCSKSWGLWDCENRKNTARFLKRKCAVFFTGKAAPTAEALPLENSRRKLALFDFSGALLFVSGAQRVRVSLSFHTYIPPPVTTLCSGRKVFSLFLHGQRILCYDKKD